MARTVTIQLSERRVLVDGQPARLRSKSFDVLALLASRPGHLFHKETLIARIWCGRRVSSDVLTGCIREIRRALDDRPQSPEWIETVSGGGYRLLHSVSMSPDAVPPAALGEDGGGEAAPVVAAASVAVLAFTPADPALAPVALALGRDIAVGLARTRWLHVAASASAASLPAGLRARDAGEALRVRYVLDGELRLREHGFVLQLCLIEAAQERILWADRVEGAAGDLAALMNDVCAPVIATVEAEIASAEEHRARLSPVRGLDPWIGFHLGMSLLRRQDPSNLVEAGKILHDSARADPACARIAAARSWHCWQRLFFGRTEDRERTLSRAREFAEDSIALDARDPLGHWALGRTEWLAGDMEGAAVNIERAVVLNPCFALGQYSLGISLYLLGRLREAAARCDTAIRISPLDPMAFAFHCLRAQLACFDGDPEGAIRHARQAADHPNVHAYGVALSAWVFELSGDREAALECLARLRHRWPGYSRARYASAMFHRSRWFAEDRRRAIDAAFDRLGFE